MLWLPVSRSFRTIVWSKRKKQSHCYLSKLQTHLVACWRTILLAVTRYQNGAFTIRGNPCRFARDVWEPPLATFWSLFNFLFFNCHPYGFCLLGCRVCLWIGIYRTNVVSIIVIFRVLSQEHWVGMLSAFWFGSWLNSLFNGFFEFDRFKTTV